MNPISMQMHTLVRLFDSLGYPNPEDPDGDWGPLGPYVRRYLAALTRVQLPQRFLQKLFGRAAGPHPDPWRGIALSASALDQMAGMVRMAEATQSGGDSMRKQILSFVDEICGTVPPRPPFPWPGPWPPPEWFDDPRKAAVLPSELVQIGVAVFRVSQTLGDSELGSTLADASRQLTETGLQRLEQSRALAHNA